jgi:hypothetical protein
MTRECRDRNNDGASVKELDQIAVSQIVHAQEFIAIVFILLLRARVFLNDIQDTPVVEQFPVNQQSTQIHGLKPL